MADKRDIMISNGRTYIRNRDGEITTGELTPVLRANEPIQPGCERVRTKPLPGAPPGVYVVESIYDATEVPGPMQVEDKSGPAKVTSHAYRANWDDVDWSKADDSLPN